MNISFSKKKKKVVKYYPLIEEIYPNKKYISNLLISENSHLVQLRFLSLTFIHSQKKSSTFIISIKPLKEVQKKKKLVIVYLQYLKYPSNLLSTTPNKK